MITILCEQQSARTDYAFDLVFRNILGIEIAVIGDEAHYDSVQSAKCVYGRHPREQGVFFRAAGLLHETGIRKCEPEAGEIENLPALFRVEPPSDLSHDLFSAVFYLVSRYEEYLPHQMDKHGRYLACQSTAYRHGFLNVPIVDLWCGLIANTIKKHYPEVAPTERSFRHISTIDIDNAFAYTGKGFVRTIGGMGRSVTRMDIDDLTGRISVLRGKRRDPYDTYEYMREQAENCASPVKSFILMGKRGPFDKNLPHGSKEQAYAIEAMAGFSEVGIHPSYASAGKAEVVKREKERLEEALRKPVKISRQHFLRLKFPETYRALLACGIKEDHSMGYSETCGFRAGTCTPFNYFDLEAESGTALVLHPFAVMDRTLNSRAKMNPSEAIQRIAALAESVRNVHGTFITVWHNESLSDSGEWKGWLPVYEHLQGYGAG